MLDAIDISSRTSMDIGAMTAFGKNRSDKARERAEAIRQGQSAGSDQEMQSKVREVAEDFVSVFMNQVMKSMRATVQENPAMHGDNGEKFFQEMLDGEQAKFLAKGSGYGLTELVYQSLMSGYQASMQQQQGEAAEAQAMEDTLSEAAVEAEDDLVVEATE